MSRRAGRFVGFLRQSSKQGVETWGPRPPTAAQLTSRRASLLPRNYATTSVRSSSCSYIKLGQFIASSPTLFPEEYVLEFQKCLDATEPVPFEVIRCVPRLLGSV